MKIIKWFMSISSQLFLAFFLIMSVFAINVSTAWSHAYVIEESPAPNSYHEKGPSEVKIAFSSKVENNLYTIQVFDAEQKEVATEGPQISADQQEIRLPLPVLDGGIYTVEYHVISSNDGHPIQKSFAFHVAHMAAPLEQLGEDRAPVSNPLQQEGTDHAAQTESTALDQTKIQASDSPFPSVADFIFQFMRTVYYFGLLFQVGWIFLWRIVKNYSVEVKKRYMFWGTIIQMLHLAGLMTMFLIQLNIFTANGFTFSIGSPFQLSFGMLSIVSLFMSLIGFLFLFKKRSFDYTWVFIIVMAKSLNGHALEFEPTVLLVLINGIHLVAASIWAAGLLFIVLFWRKHILYVKAFLPKFSNYAFFSMIVLSLTGIFISFIYLSGSEFLFTDRGILLMIKAAIVLIVVMTGGIIRSRMKEMRAKDLKIWVSVDFVLMLLVIIIVSILTYLNPLQ